MPKKEQYPNEFLIFKEGLQRTASQKSQLGRRVALGSIVDLMDEALSNKKDEIIDHIRKVKGQDIAVDAFHWFEKLTLQGFFKELAKHQRGVLFLTLPIFEAILEEISRISNSKNFKGATLVLVCNSSDPKLTPSAIKNIPIMKNNTLKTVLMFHDSQELSVCHARRNLAGFLWDDAF